MDMPSSKSVYLRAINVPQGDDVFEIRRGQRGSIPVLTPIKAASIPTRGGFAAVGKAAYCIGGNPVKQQSRHGHHRIRKVASLFSLDNTLRSWKRLTPMRNARSEPQTVAVDDKIYVIGGADDDDDPEEEWGEVFDTESGRLVSDDELDKWGEVFDTESGKWGSLSPPLPLPEAYGEFAVAIPESKKFVLGSLADNFLYFYEAEEGRWKLVEHKMDLKVRPGIQPVGVGTCLIWLQNKFTLHAYDWIEERSYMGYIKDLDKALPLKHLMEHDDSPYDPPLIHLSGNLFCLFWLEYLCVGPRISLLHCVTFRISPPLNGMLKANVTSSQVFVIPTPVRISAAAVPT